MLPTYCLALHQPPPTPAPTLSVSAAGRAYLSKALAARLGLRTGQPIDVLPPGPGNATWQLDLRPTAARRVAAGADMRPRVRHLPQLVGLAPAGCLLRLALGAEPLAAGLYPLLPVAPTE